MNPPGAVDAKYVSARRRLLDTLESLGDHMRKSVVVVGAQAVYLRVADMPTRLVAYTTDGDITVDPRGGATGPDVTKAMERADFRLDEQPGIWRTQLPGDDVTTVDLMVPEAFNPEPGKRSARLDGESTRAARYVQGVEACIVDYDRMVIASLDDADPRRYEVGVAGPAALIIAKLFKLRDRLANVRRPDRIEPKDAYEVFRLLQLQKDDIVSRWRVCLLEDVSRAVAQDAIAILDELFGTRASTGARLAAEYSAHVEDAEVTKASAALLAREVVAELG